MRDYATSPIYPFARLRSGYAFKSGDWIETGIQVVKIANVSDGQLNLTDASRVSAETAEGAKNAGLRSGDVLVGMTGYVGSVARVRPRDLPCVLNQRVGIVEVTDPGAVSLDYLYFALRSQHAKAQMESLAHGSAQPNLSPKGFGQVEIALPPLPEQRRIAAVLGALDDLIDTNQRLSANTEALLSELFADLQFDSAPTGDRATKLSSVIGVNPAIPKPSGPVPFVDMASLSTSTARISGYTERDAASSVRFTNGDALMARITPCLENGKAAYVDCLPEGKVASGSTEFIVLRASGNVPQAWPYFLLRSGRFRAYAIRHMTGTSGRQRCPAESVASYPIATPEPAALRAFGDAANPLMQVLADLATESKELRNTRDELLPLLMSGAVSPGEVEAVA